MSKKEVWDILKSPPTKPRSIEETLVDEIALQMAADIDKAILSWVKRNKESDGR